MKVVITTLIFLYSISSAAQSVLYNDGSYYNDDYIHNGNIMPEVPAPKEYRPTSPVAVIDKIERPRAQKSPRRKPAGGFYEVKSSGGSVGTFKEIGGGVDEQTDSRGSK